jgi:hypothetical protein
MERLPQKFRAAPAPMHPVLRAAGFGHRGDPRVLLDLGRVRIAVTLRAKAAIRRGTSTSPAWQGIEDGKIGVGLCELLNLSIVFPNRFV